MSLVENAIERFQGIIRGDRIKWDEYLKPEDQARILPASTLAEEGKKRLLVGSEAQSGLLLPWDKAKNRVRVKPGKLCVWTGWSHHGKTAMLKQVMLGAIQQGEKVLIASMEEEVSEVWEDLCVMGCGRSDPSAKSIDEFISFISGNLWLYDQEGRIDANRMQAVIRYCAKELGITQCVIDSLMMLSVNRDDYNAQSEFVGDLKTIAKDEHCTIHLVAHMRKREGKTGEEVPGGPHDIAGGHEIASKADYVFNVWRDKARKDTTKPAAILGVEKQRGRQNWIGKLGFDFDHSSRQFIEGNFPMTFWGSSEVPI